MHPSQLKRHFGTQKAIARAYGISEPSVSMWFRTGRVPKLRQYQLVEALARASADPRQSGGPAVPAGQESSQDTPDLTQPSNT